ncbi:MAG: hypothetical protein M5U01_30620 [Ardenticatenaceae bacterium]|nr:hypothetical protein [Ardenticatenaceae bacterium]
MAHRIRVIQYGLGPIGSAVARHVVERTGLELVGAVDINPVMVGKDVGELIGLDRSLGFPVNDRLVRATERAEADVVIQTTGSYLHSVKHQIIEILETGLNVVSTAEELSFPWLTHPEEAAEIDAVAKRVGKTVLGSGVNPGFIMDTLPLSLTAICQRVDHIDVTRIINASTRRGSFQAKIGSSMTLDDFETKMAAGRMGHVGLPESVGMVFYTLGKKLVHYESQVEPVVAERPIQTDSFEVLPGQVSGLKQVARGYSEEGEFMQLTFIAALDAGEDGDVVKVTGKPDLEVKLKGTNGDIATVAIVVNAVRLVKAAMPGLVTMRDLPIITAG